MYQKLSWLFMIFWVAGIIAMSIFQQFWLMKYMVSAFLVFWVWGFIRSLLYQDQARKKKKDQSMEENYADKQVTEKEEERGQSLPQKRKSIFNGLFDRPDDRFKR